MVKFIVDLPTHKRKRFNKNKKKAWRRKTDISDVEERLEEKRQEERHGGPLEEKDDSELMYLDVGDDDDVKEEKDAGIKKEDDVKPFVLEYTVDKQEKSGGKKAKDIMLKPRRNTNADKPLKAHQFIDGLPGAKIPVKPRMKEGTLTVAMKRKTKLQAKDPKVAKKALKIFSDFSSNKKRAQAKRKKENKNNIKTDLWEEGADSVTKECTNKGLDESFIKGIANYYSTQMKVRPVKVPGNRFIATSSLETVQTPAAGQSYNPTYEDHQNLLRRAVNQEKRKKKGEIFIKRQLTDFFPTKDKAPTEQTWLNEMAEGLPRAGEEDEEEEEEKKGGEEIITVTSRPKTEKKTKKQRRKERKAKLAEIRRLEKKKERIRSNAVYRIKTLKKQIDDAERLTQMRIASRLARKQDLLSKPRRLGKYKYRPEDIAVQLGDELPDCLRRAKPVTSIMEDRFRNYQRRNLIETRISAKNKKNIKLQTKRGHREALAEVEKITPKNCNSST